MNPNDTEVVIIEVQIRMTPDGYWRAFFCRPALPEADAAPGWYSRSKKSAMAHALRWLASRWEKEVRNAQ